MMIWYKVKHFEVYKVRKHEILWGFLPNQIPLNLEL